jgi:hypothetical protein
MHQSSKSPRRTLSDNEASSPKSDLHAQRSEAHPFFLHHFLSLKIHLIGRAHASLE